jgi:hypothetical protein
MESTSSPFDPNAERFFFDDFFISDASEGESVLVPMQGRSVPITLKKNLTLADLEESREKGLDKTLDLKTGQYTIHGFDEKAYTYALLARAIKSWPFVNRDGSSVPITEDNIKHLVADGGGALEQLVQKFVQQKEEQAAPFVNNSGEASLPEEMPTPPSL